MSAARHLASFAISLVVATGVIAIWQAIASAGLVPQVFLPSPVRTFAALAGGFTQGPLLAATLATVQRMVLGWLVACLAGVVLGALLGSSRRLRIYLGPMLEALRPVPSSALIPIFIAAVGLSEGMIIGVIAFGALWPMLLATMHGLASVEPLLYEVASALRMRRVAVIRKIGLPNAVPDIVASMRLSLTIALILAVVGEMLTGRVGLGQWLLVTSRSFAAAQTYAGIIVLGALGFLTNAAMTVAEKRALRWKAR